MPERQSRLVGDERRALAQVLADRYGDGAAIRSLAQECGRSYGLVRRLLVEAGVEFRARGGIDPGSPQAPGEQGGATGTDDDATGSDPQSDDVVTGEDLEKAEAKASAKARKAEQRLAKALRNRAKLTKSNSSKKERKAAKKKVSRRRRKADKAAERLQRIREEMDAHSDR